MKNKNRFTLRLSENQFNFLKGFAEKEERSISGTIRRIISDFQEKMGETDTGNDNNTCFSRLKRSSH